MTNIEDHFKENCLHHCHSHKSLTIGSEDEPQSYLFVTFPFSCSSPLKRALNIIINGFQQCSIFFYGFFKTYRRSQQNKYFLCVIKNCFHSMMVWIAWEPPLYTHSTSHSRWTRNQRATSMIFGRSTQNTWMKKRKPQKQGLTGLDFEINVKNCQKMSKYAKNRENWSFPMSCSSETSMVRGGFFYIVSKIMHERTTTESLVTIARWFFFQL